jgi:hypothetical protein
MKKILLLIMITAIVFTSQAGISMAQEEEESQGNIWAGVWTQGSFYKTNSERNNFNSVLARSEGRLGFNVKQFPLKPYFVYLLAYSQDENYWNNNAAFGLGVRAYPFSSYQPTTFADEWIKDIKFFLEAMTLTFIKDRETASANNVRTYDYRAGLDLWHEWNQKDPNYSAPWAEIWADLSYRATDFYQDDFSTFLLDIQHKFGVYMGILKPYLKIDLRMGGREEPWWNYIFYGGGFRFEPFRSEKEPNPWLEKFKMFFELYGIAWIKEKDSRPVDDMKFGVEFTFGR